MRASTASPARRTSTSSFDAGRDFEREIVVKVNVPEVLRAELARAGWKREHVAMGTNTDPYQWVEGRYKLMRGIWEALRDAANPCSILTKSPLLLRDLDLMREVAARTEISACLSVPTLDEKAWRASEPHTPHPRARLEAVGELNRGRDPDGHPDRAADARASTTRPSRSSGSSSSRPRRARSRSAARRCSCAARCAGSSSTGCAPTGPIWCRATSGSTPAAPTCPSASGVRSSAPPACRARDCATTARVPGRAVPRRAGSAAARREGGAPGATVLTRRSARLRRAG